MQMVLWVWCNLCKELLSGQRMGKSGLVGEAGATSAKHGGIIDPLMAFS